MKRNYIILAVLLLTTIFYGCEKNAVQEITVPPTGAKVKFFNFSVGSPVVNFYANASKISAALSASGAESATAGVAYAAVFPSTNAYALVSPGAYSLNAKRPTTATADPGTTVATLSTTLVDGKEYSMYMAGIYNTTTKTSDAFIIEDNLPAIDTTVAYVRFVNTISNSTPVNLVVRNTTTLAETVVATNIAYKGVSTFVKMPTGVYDLVVRNPTTSLNIFTRLGVSIFRSNTYTFGFRGNFLTASTLFIDNTPNR